jgi:cryptochrome
MFGDAMNGVGRKDNIQDRPEGRDENDGAVDEDESGAKERGGQNKGGDKLTRGRKRKGGQGTLDGLIKRSKR